MARATRSSLKAHRSSMEPPPRPVMMHVPQLPAVGVPDGPHDLRRGLRPLDPHRQQQHLGDGIAPPQDAYHVMDRRPGAA